MARSRRRFAIWVCILGTTTLAIGISVATGANLKTKSKTVEAEGLEHVAATAKCKPGQKAVSGGFDAEEFDFDTDTGPLFFSDQSSGTGGRSWTGEAVNTGEAEGDFTSHAYCRDEKVKRRSFTESVGIDDTETLTAKCKPGTTAVSGGFDAEEATLSLPPTPLFLVTVSRKVGKRTWEVTARNRGNEIGDLSVQVNCHEGKALKTKQTSVLLEDDGQAAFDLEAKCKRNQRVISGGFAGGSDFPIPSEGGGIVPFASMKTGKRAWHVDGFGEGEVTAYAYCEKKKAK
jgi:hypothetical protein